MPNRPWLSNLGILWCAATAVVLALVGCEPGQVGVTEDGQEGVISDELKGGRKNRCGDGICGGPETCSTCEADCGQCAGTGDGSGSGSGSSGGGSGGGGSGGGAVDCANAASWPATWASYEQEVLTLVNQRRAAGATCGTTVVPAVGPLVMNAALQQAARCHSLDMATQNYFSHTSLDGRSPWERIAAAGYDAFGSGENIAAGYSTPSAVVAGWMASPGHCANIMSSANETGIGYAFGSGSTYGAYWTETFGSR